MSDQQEQQQEHFQVSQTPHASQGGAQSGTAAPTGTLPEILAFDKRSAVDKRITDVRGGPPAAPGHWTVLSAYEKIIGEQ